ncbi:MAG: hypothetical protein P4L79_06450 [Legionella sp.]|uniref:hypothetical protein n=1 Tax=Legionella sp. TaxID=459 RepID=UPI002846DC70|nr:hypothetical protein [Legionella sp.]
MGYEIIRNTEKRMQYHQLEVFYTKQFLTTFQQQKANYDRFQEEIGYKAYDHELEAYLKEVLNDDHSEEQEWQAKAAFEKNYRKNNFAFIFGYIHPNLYICEAVVAQTKDWNAPVQFLARSSNDVIFTDALGSLNEFESQIAEMLDKKIAEHGAYVEKILVLDPDCFNEKSFVKTMFNYGASFPSLILQPQFKDRLIALQNKGYKLAYTASNEQEESKVLEILKVNGLSFDISIEITKELAERTEPSYFF